MVNTEFWYAECGSRAEGRSKVSRQSKRWWLPVPQVQATGLSDTAKQKLLNQGRVVHQVFKAARSINESVLLEMPVPTVIRDALPKVMKLFFYQSILNYVQHIKFFNLGKSKANPSKNHHVLDNYTYYALLIIVKINSVWAGFSFTCTYEDIESTYC